jgi:mannosyltransferase OCH1-like enzyme
MIPNIIWQTHQPERKDLPYPFNLNSKNWQDKNPSFGYMYTSAAQRLEDIRKYAPQLEQIYKTSHVVAQADIWRYVITYEFGGFYADMDSICIKPLDLSILNNEFILSRMGISYCQQCDKTYGGNYANGFFGCEPKSEIMLNLINYIEEKDKEMRELAIFDKYHHVTDYFAFSKIIVDSNKDVSVVFNKYDFNCTEGNCSRASEICHGKWHKFNYHDIEYQKPIDFRK